MAQKTRSRKAEHIKICLEQKAQAKVSSGFQDLNLIHRALPEVNKQEINLSTTFLGKKLAAPIIVGAMTGGCDEAIQINGNIAQAVESLKLGMGLGSQRAALENQQLEESFNIVRKNAPNAFLIANIGGVQFVHGYGANEVRKIVKMIDADAVAVHLNALQEASQPEGQTKFKGVLAAIGQVAGDIDIPVIVKETGAGICAEDAKMLKAAGVAAIDVSGLGGTSFAAVEYYRATNPRERELSEAFWNWGIPTAASLIEVTKAVKIPVIASGGLRTGIDIAKALVLNASIASITQPILETAVNSAGATEAKLLGLIEELRTAMFLVGAEKISELPRKPVVITGKTAEWLKNRGFDLSNYANRGLKRGYRKVP